MEYKGYNGSIAVEGETLRITHSGMAAKAGGLVRDQPRNIPLQAISDVRIKEATRLTNGHLTLGLGGRSAVEVGSQAASNPDTLMFTHKSNEQFKRLHHWLLTVVEHNRVAGIDSSAVQFDAAGQTRMDLSRARAEKRPQEHQARQTDKMSKLLGDERPDIVAAAARMGWRMGGRRELKKLAEHLHDGETVRFIAQGTYEGHQGILVLTDLRLLFLFHGLVGQSKEDFPLRLIASVHTKSGFSTGELRLCRQQLLGHLGHREVRSRTTGRGCAPGHGQPARQRDAAARCRSTYFGAGGGLGPVRGAAETRVTTRCGDHLPRGIRDQEAGTAQTNLSDAAALRHFVREASASETVLLGLPGLRTQLQPRRGGTP